MMNDLAHKKNSAIWVAAAFAVVLIVSLGLRLGTNISRLGAQWDEQYIRVPIEDLINKGWSVKTAIDFKESKGPAFIWPYALLGEITGSQLNDLRLITVMFFVAGIVPLILICRRCGVSHWALPLIALLYVLIPQNAVLGQLVMSEPSFVFGGLWLLWAFLWGFGETSRQEKRVWGPIVFGVLLAILLHNRIHAVAFAGAAALVAFERDRFRSWPWWLACALAGLMRVPLWMRWGGLVSPEYAELHSLGFRVDSLTYLAAALAPYTAVLLWPVFMQVQFKKFRWMCFAGAALGLALVIVAPVHLDRTLLLEIEGESGPRPVYQGMAATLCRAVPATYGPSMAISAMTVIGLASLGALAAISLSQSVTQQLGQSFRLQFWTLLCGWCMYMMTSGYLFDRFIMAWAILMPIVWLKALPRWLIILQAIALALALAHQINVYLMKNEGIVMSLRS
jgi:hypothetical protein